MSSHTDDRVTKLTKRVESLEKTIAAMKQIFKTLNKQLDVSDDEDEDDDDEDSQYQDRELERIANSSGSITLLDEYKISHKNNRYKIVNLTKQNVIVRLTRNNSNYSISLVNEDSKVVAEINMTDNNFEVHDTLSHRCYYHIFDRSNGDNLSRLPDITYAAIEEPLFKPYNTIVERAWFSLKAGSHTMLCEIVMFRYGMIIHILRNGDINICMRPEYGGDDLNLYYANGRLTTIAP
jgi:hypothetical protein